MQLSIDKNFLAYEQSFSEFKEELKITLLDHHSKTNSTLSLGPFFTHGRSPLEDFYVPPTLSEVMRQTTCDQKGPLKNKKQRITSLEPLLKLNDTKKQFTILTANAGVGKTSFCNFLAFLWCARHKETLDVFNKLEKRFNVSCDVLKDISYLFYIDMNNIRSKDINSVEEILHIHLKDEIGYSDNKKQLYEMLFTKERGLVILEGLDESAISKLKPPLANRAYSVLLTCRPWKLADMDIPRDTFLHVSVDVLNEKSIKELFANANKCLNEHYGTAFKVEDFFAAVEIPNLQSLTSNTLVGLQLYCQWHDRLMANETSQNSAANVKFGKTRSHIYADVLEMMFELGRKKYKDNSQRTQTQDPIQMRLPTCFERCNMCKTKSDTLYKLGMIAFQRLLNLKVYFDQETMNLLKEEEFLLASGLITADWSLKCSIKNKEFRFLHQTYHDFLAAVYLSSLELENWIQYHFLATFSPDILSFLCVMDYEKGCRCVEMFACMDRRFYRKSKFHIGEMIEYQSAVLQAYNECLNNGVPEPQLAIRHIYIDEKLMTVDHHLLKLNAKMIKTCAMMKGDERTEMYMNVTETMKTIILPSLETYLSNLQIFPKTSITTLKLIWLDDFQIQEDEIDIVSCVNLKVLILKNLHLRCLTIAPAQLEKFLVSTSEDRLGRIPPMKVSYAQGQQYSRQLRKLCLSNITLIERLNLSQCDKLQELHLDTLTFPDDFHLNIKSCTDLTEITLQNLCLRELTIAPAQLEIFLVYTRRDLRDDIPSMKVKFAHGKKFSSKHRELTLVNVKLNMPLDISQCDQVQELRLDTSLLSDVHHMDLSSLKDLTMISLENNRLQHVTIAPAKLRHFGVRTTRKFLSVNRLPIELTFAHGEPFSSKLEVLRLDNSLLDGGLNIVHCNKLKELLLHKCIFPDNYHLDLSPNTELTVIILQDLHIRHVTFAPTKVENFWVAISGDLVKETQPLKVTFLDGAQFTNKLTKLSLINIISDDFIDIRHCSNIKEMQLSEEMFSKVKGVPEEMQQRMNKLPSRWYNAFIRRLMTGHKYLIVSWKVGDQMP